MCQHDGCDAHVDDFTDPRDGEVYKTVRIGDQVWLAENLRYDCNENDAFKKNEGIDDQEWYAEYLVECCAYEKNEENVKRYGKLYSWNTALTCAPEGWHLPSQEEWLQLNDYVKKHAAGSVGTALRSNTNDWEKSDGLTRGTDAFGFCALPAGWFNILSLGFWELGRRACFWSADEHALYSAEAFYLDFGSEDLVCDSFRKECALSVRLVRDRILPEEMKMPKESQISFLDDLGL